MVTDEVGVGKLARQANSRQDRDCRALFCLTTGDHAVFAAAIAFSTLRLSASKSSDKGRYD